MAVGFTDSRAKLQSKLRELGATQSDHPASASQITVNLAIARIDLEAAAFLLESLYAEHGYRVSRLDPSPASDVILVARQRGEAVGTLTLRADGPAGLRADESYGVELAGVRALGRRACELSRFAVAGNAAAIRALFGFAYRIVREVWESTDVFIEVNPRHVAFYCRVFGFAIAGGERTCARVLAPSVLLRLEVAAFEARNCAPGGRATSRSIGPPALN